MKIAVIASSLLCTTAFAAFNGPLPKAMSAQKSISADDGWHMFYFTNPNVLAVPQFTICTNTPILLRVTDAFCGGDTFGVFANGTKLGGDGD